MFIDRDGTLNEEVGYLCRPEDVVLIPGAREAVARLNAAGHAGDGGDQPGRDRPGQVRLGRLPARSWTASTSCWPKAGRTWTASTPPRTTPRALGEYAHPDHPDRKPNPGMLLRAAEEHGLDLARSWMIGDKALDLEAGRNAGCRVALVRTGYGREVDGALADLVAEDLGEAVARILAS